MATNMYMDARGRIYTGSSPTNSSDSIMGAENAIKTPSLSVAGLAIVTTTPAVAQTVTDAVNQAAGSAGTKWNPVNSSGRSH